MDGSRGKSLSLAPVSIAGQTLPPIASARAECRRRRRQQTGAAQRGRSGSRRVAEQRSGAQAAAPTSPQPGANKPRLLRPIVANQQPKHQGCKRLQSTGRAPRARWRVAAPRPASRAPQAPPAPPRRPPARSTRRRRQQKAPPPSPALRAGSLRLLLLLLPPLRPELPSASPPRPSPSTALSSLRRTASQLAPAAACNRPPATCGPSQGAHSTDVTLSNIACAERWLH